MNHCCCGEWKYCPYCGKKLDCSISCQPFNPNIYCGYTTSGGVGGTIATGGTTAVSGYASTSNPK